MPPKKNDKDKKVALAPPEGLGPGAVLDTVKQQLVQRSAEVLSSLAVTGAAEARARELEAALAESAEVTRAVEEEVTRGARLREGLLRGEIAAQAAEIERLRAALAAAGVAADAAALAAEEDVDVRDREIEALKERMGELVSEYSDMFSALLNRLAERAELVVPTVDSSSVGASVARQVSMVSKMRAIAEGGSLSGTDAHSARQLLAAVASGATTAAPETLAAAAATAAVAAAAGTPV